MQEYYPRSTRWQIWQDYPWPDLKKHQMIISGSSNLQLKIKSVPRTQHIAKPIRRSFQVKFGKHDCSYCYCELKENILRKSIRLWVLQYLNYIDIYAILQSKIEATIPQVYIYITK